MLPIVVILGALATIVSAVFVWKSYDEGLKTWFMFWLTMLTLNFGCLILNAGHLIG